VGRRDTVLVDAVVIAQSAHWLSPVPWPRRGSSDEQFAPRTRAMNRLVMIPSRSGTRVTG
jgi:hypothetical protein